MTNIRDISDKIYSNPDDRERMTRMNDVYYRMADWVKEYNAGAYQEFVNDAENVLYSITTDEAEKIVSRMRPYGQHWDRETIDEFVASKGATPSTDYYLAMNMAFNDYRNTAVEYNVDIPDFYFSIARDFISDPDAEPHKVEKYFKK